MGRVALSRFGWTPYPVRSRPAATVSAWLPSVVFGLLLLGLWYASTATGGVPAVFLPSPVAVAQRFISDLLAGEVFSYVWPTLVESLAGAGLAALVAFPLGYAVTHSLAMSRVLEPYIAITQTVPLVALAPLLALWIGYGTWSIAVLCAVIAFFPMVTTATIGFRALEPRVVDAALLDGATGWQLLRHVELPLAAPALLAGARAGLVLSVTGAVVGEFMMGGHGLASWLTTQRDRADTVGMFASLIWISGLALVLFWLIHLAEVAASRRLDERETR